jgi:hypothetical protein
VTLSLLDTTANDMFAAIPLLWALALAFVSADVSAHDRPRALRLCVLSGVFAGIAVACKLSNGPLVLVMPLAWCMASGTPFERARRVVAAGLASIAAFVLAYGYWGWQLWTHMGNPVYPFYDTWFEPLRRLSGWGA